MTLLLRTFAWGTGVVKPTQRGMNDAIFRGELGLLTRPLRFLGHDSGAVIGT